MTTLEQDIKSAQEQLKLVEGMTLEQALKTDEHGYDQFRRIYERHEPYMHPYGFVGLSKSEEDERTIEYSNWSMVATDIFKKKLYEHHEVDNPLLYAKAYERGHSSGFQSIASEFEDIADIFKKDKTHSLLKTISNAEDKINDILGRNENRKVNNLIPQDIKELKAISESIRSEINSIYDKISNQ